MSIFSKVTWKSMWRNRTRTLVTIVGIILSAAMFTAVTTMAASLWDYLIRGAVYTDGDWFVRYTHSTEEDLQKLEADDRVSVVSDYGVLGYVTLESEEVHEDSFCLAACDQDFFARMPVHLLEGRLPENSGELVISEDVAWALEASGMGSTVGAEVALEYGASQEEPETTQTAVYTIVGLMENEYFMDYDAMYQSALTVQDENTPDILWHKLYATTHTAQDAYDMSDGTGTIYGEDVDLNYRLLSYYGTTRYSNYNQVITNFALILFAIIMVGSVSLIYNAFSISVSERTKQFGLLSSIGATKKQLRRSVLFEALCLCGIGIPVGLFAGWAGIAVTLHFLGNTIDQMFSFGAEGAVTFRAVVSWQALLVGGAAAVLTVLISALIPARRATRISPMAAIRQTEDYKTPKKNGKVSKLSYKLWGLPGVMAKKYYKTSRKKYRTTIISLAVSVILFISASTFTDMLQKSLYSSVQVENFDILFYTSDDNERAQLETIRREDCVSKSVYYETDYYVSFDAGTFSPAQQEAWDAICVNRDMDPRCRNVDVYYVEDEAFFAYLEEQGIDPAPYQDSENPTALVCNQTLNTYYYQDENGEWTRYSYHIEPVSEGTETVQLLTNGLPEELPWEEDGNAGIGGWEYLTLDGQLGMRAYSILELEDGTVTVDEENAVYFIITAETDENGDLCQTYYAYDPETGTRAQEPSGVLEDAGFTIRLGARIDELPFGIQTNVQDNPYSWALIAPLSAKTEDGDNLGYYALNAGDYGTLKSKLDEIGEYSYVDYREDEENSRSLMLMINVFSYGFIILISLICAANVFNTISTNIALRRRDFGMLRSVGMKTKELYRMMNFECVIYGIRSLLFGLPISLLISWAIQKSTMEELFDAAFTIPWAAAMIAVVSVFLVVFTSMLYAVTKLRKDNPIDALRAENL